MQKKKKNKNETEIEQKIEDRSEHIWMGEKRATRDRERLEQNIE